MKKKLSIGFLTVFFWLFAEFVISEDWILLLYKTCFYALSKYMRHLSAIFESMKLVSIQKPFWWVESGILKCAFSTISTLLRLYIFLVKVHEHKLILEQA